MINLKNPILLILILIIIGLFGVFSLTPMGIPFIYLLLLFSTIGHFLFFAKPIYFNSLVKKWYFIGLAMMLVSILTTNLYYGQSFVSGFVANITFYFTGGSILFLYLMQKYNISIFVLEKWLIITGWLFLFLMLIMSLTGFAFINESELTGKVVVVNMEKISKNYINFIAIIFIAKFFTKGNLKFLIFSICFFSANHFYEIQRFNLLATLLIIFAGYIIRGNFKANLKLAVIAFFSFFSIGIYLFESERGGLILDRFYEASKIVSGKEDNINDVSTSIRISETEFALERFYQHPILGNGFPRPSESDKIIGEDIYFHISDVGLFGILYTLGIFGIIVVVFQLKLTIQTFKNHKTNYFFLTISLLFLFIMINTLLSGTSINNYLLYFFYLSFYVLIKQRFTTK